MMDHAFQVAAVLVSLSLWRRTRPQKACCRGRPRQRARSNSSGNDDDHLFLDVLRSAHRCHLPIRLFVLERCFPPRTSVFRLQVEVLHAEVEVRWSHKKDTSCQLCETLFWSLVTDWLLCFFSVSEIMLVSSLICPPLFGPSVTCSMSFVSCLPQLSFRASLTLADRRLPFCSGAPSLTSSHALFPVLFSFSFLLCLGASM